MLTKLTNENMSNVTGGVTLTTCYDICKSICKVICSIDGSLFNNQFEQEAGEGV